MKIQRNKWSWAEPHSSFPLILQTTFQVKISHSRYGNLFGQRENLLLKKVWSINTILSGWNLGPTFFESKQIWVQMLVLKNVVSRKFVVVWSENFGSTFFGEKLCSNFFGQTKFLVKIMFGEKHLWVKEIFGRKHLRFQKCWIKKNIQP